MNLPFWPFYVGDYLADTMHLSYQEHGVYLLLMMAYWKHQGPLPDNDDDLRNICKVSPPDWVAIRRRVAPFFKINGGFWHHKRIDADIQKQQARYLAMSQGGMAGNRKRWQSPPESPPESGSVSHSESPPVSQPEPEPEPLSEPEPESEPSTPRREARGQTVDNRGQTMDTHGQNINHSQRPLSNCERITFDKERDRLETRLDAIRNSYDEHRDWSEKDKAEARKLKARLKEVQAKLGVMV